jgi:hypothetical protein
MSGCDKVVLSFLKLVFSKILFILFLIASQTIQIKQIPEL